MVRGAVRISCERLPRSGSTPGREAGRTTGRLRGRWSPLLLAAAGSLPPARRAAPPRRQQPHLVGLGSRGPRPRRALGAASRRGLRGVSAPSRRALPVALAPPRGRAVFAAFAAGLALAGEPEVVIDASRYFTQAKQLELFGPSVFLPRLGRRTARLDRPAAAGVPLRVGLSPLRRAPPAAAGLHRRSLRADGIRDGAHRRTARDARAGARGALLLPPTPCLLVQVPLLMADVPAMSAVTVAFWAFLETLERGGARRIAVSALALAAALLAKYSTWVLLGGGLWVHPASRGAAQQMGLGRLGGCAAIVAGALAPALFALAKPDLVQRQLALLAGFQWEGLRRSVGRELPLDLSFPDAPAARRRRAGRPLARVAGARRSRARRGRAAVGALRTRGAPHPLSAPRFPDDRAAGGPGARRRSPAARAGSPCWPPRVSPWSRSSRSSCRS